MTEEAIDKYFIFAIVRNPYNRLISAFQYIYKDNKEEKIENVEETLE